MFHRRIHLPREVNFKSYRLRYASKTYSQYQDTVKLLGSFRLAAGNRHLHRYCIFTERVSETVLQSLHYSTRQNFMLIPYFHMGTDYIFISRMNLECWRIMLVLRNIFIFILIKNPVDTGLLLNNFPRYYLVFIALSLNNAQTRTSPLLANLLWKITLPTGNFLT